MLEILKNKKRTMAGSLIRLTELCCGMALTLSGGCKINLSLNISITYQSK